MTSTCLKCGGLIVAEQVLDFYQTQEPKCVNCGWHSREAQQWHQSVPQFGEQRSIQVNLLEKRRHAMKENGMYVLNFQVPALVERELIYLRGTEFLWRLVALCFLPYAGLIAADEIDHQARQFEAVETTLVVVGSGTCPLHRLWLDEEKPWTPVLADPCGQLHRSFGVAVSARSPRCHTFVIDREGILRLRVTHDFVDGDLATLRRIMELQGSTGADSGSSQGTTPEIRTDYLPV